MSLPPMGIDQKRMQESRKLALEAAENATKALAYGASREWAAEGYTALAEVYALIYRADVERSRG